MPETQWDGGHLRSALNSAFGPIDESACAEIAAEVEWLEAPGGSVLFREGESGDCLYLLLRGRLLVSARDPERCDERLLAEITAGEAVGEMGWLTGDARSATVRAVRDSLLVRIGAGAFERLAHRHPAVLRQLSKVVVRRLLHRSAARRFSPRVSNVAVVSIHAGDLAGRFADDLSAELEHFGPCLRVDAARADALLGVAAAAQAPPGSERFHRLGEWLDEQESKQRFVLYQADAAASEWTRRCLRQADLVLLVGDAGDDPALTRLERELFDAEPGPATARRVLVLVQPPGGSAPSGTARWLGERKLDGHHHVRSGHADDLARLARMLAGNGVGLVLGGGAARGFAHIGVFRALCELGIPVDWVGGSSIGSVFASGIALGWDPDRLQDVARRAFVNENPLGDFTLPVVALLRGKRLERLAQRYFDLDIEDLQLPFFCVSSDLSNAQLTLHERGSLWRAIRASVALPGVLPPAVAGDHLVVDGGILNNLPIDVMRDQPVGHVIAVDLSVRKEYQLDYAEIPGALRVLRSRLPFARRIRVPGIVTLMMKATEVASLVHARSVRPQADLVLEPPVGRFGILDTRSFDAIVEVGYEHALERLRDWRGREPRRP